jgi:hypothetical protein
MVFYAMPSLAPWPAQRESIRSRRGARPDAGLRHWIAFPGIRIRWKDRLALEANFH